MTILVFHFLWLLMQPAQKFSRTRGFVKPQPLQAALSHLNGADWTLVYASGNIPLALCIGS